VGVSLSVTPTFISGDTMLLAVKAARTFFEIGTPNSSFDQQVQTSRNAVIANVMIKFGQTLVLSGLSERETSETSTGVPGLKDLPLVQYLFGNNTKHEMTKSVVFMLTPRAPVTGQDIPPIATKENSTPPERVKDLLKREGFNIAPNMEAIFRQMSRNPFYREFRTNDLVSEEWRRETYIERLLNDFSGMLVF
jgi:Flp pilus assembly secretin CpaC